VGSTQPWILDRGTEYLESRIAFTSTNFIMLIEFKLGGSFDLLAD